MRAALRRVVPAVAVVATLAAGAPATAIDGVPGTTATESLVGTYELLAKDVLDPHGDLTHVYQDVLRVPGRAIPITLPAGHGLTGGTPVKVAARRYGTTSAYTVSSFQRLAPASVLGSAGTSSVLVILAYWTAPDSMTRTRAAAQIFGDDDKWYREVSYGKAGLAGVVTPWVKIPAPAGGQCYTDAEGIRADAVAKAATLGATYNAGNYQRTILYFPRCTGSDTRNVAGWAYEPGSVVWLNGVMDRRTSVHELGHSYGLGHARSYVCKSPSGTRVSLSRSCTAPEYGDPYDAMGTSSYVAHFTGYRKDRAGWLGNRKRVMTTSSSTFTLPPFEKPSSLPVVVVANSPTVATRRYWLEYRRPVGMDARLPSGATGGVMVHIEDAVPRGWLLDPTPRDSSMTTAVIKPGTTWTAPDYVRVKVSSISSTGARVTVTGAKPAPLPPSAPRSLVLVPDDRSATVSWAPPASTGGAPVLGYEVVATSSSAGSQTRATSATTTEITLSGLTNGATYTISVRARTEAGAGTAASATVVPYLTNPSARLVEPVAGAVLTGQAMLRATVVPNPDTDSPIECVEFVVDNVSLGSCASRDELGRYAMNWRSSALPDGPHSIRVRATDSRNRTAVTAPVQVTTDNPFPEVALTAPVTGSQHNADLVWLTAAASVPEDPAATIASVTFYDVTSIYESRLGGDWSAPFELGIDVSRVAGPRRVVAVARSSTGLETRSAPVDFTVVHPPPSVTLKAPATAAGPTLPLSADAVVTAAGHTVSRVEFLVNGALLATDTTAPYEATWDIRAVTGEHRLTARVVESSGRTATSPETAVTVTNAIPVLRLTGPEGRLGPGTVQVTGFATAAPGGEAPSRVSVVIDGVQQADPAIGADGAWSVPWESGARFGSHVVTVRAHTAGGLMSPEIRHTFYVDRPAVVTSVAAPGQDAVLVAGASYTASVAAATQAGDPTTITAVCLGYLLYGQYWGTFGCSSTPVSAGRYDVPLSVTATSGSYQLMLSVRMSDGFRHYVPAHSVFVARPPRAPALWAAPADGGLRISVTAGGWEPVPATYHLTVGGETRTVSPGETLWTGLTNGVTYDVSAYAVNAAGTGPASTTTGRPGMPTAFDLRAAPGEAQPYGTVVTVVARLRDERYAALGGQPVRLVSCPTATNVCTEVATGTTDVNGIVGLPFAVTERARMTYEFAGTAQYAPSRGPGDGIFVSPTPVMTIELASSTVDHPAAASVTGTIRPATSTYVVAEVLVDGAWLAQTPHYWTSGTIEVPLSLTPGTYRLRMRFYNNYYGRYDPSNELTLTVTP